MKKFISLLLLMALMLTPAAFAEEADMVAYGRIYTSNEAQPWAEAMAIQDGKFV
jgi:hypothetical protein